MSLEALCGLAKQEQRNTDDPEDRHRIIVALRALAPMIDDQTLSKCIAN